MRVLIIGAGIGGLATALSLHAAGIDCVLADSAAELRPLGVGINIQPHAVRELTELGLGEALSTTGIATSVQTYTNRYGQPILTLPRGRSAGYAWPQYSIHRGHLQMLMLAAVKERLGPEKVRLSLAFEAFEQDSGSVTALMRDLRTGRSVAETGDVLVGADGLHSTVRRRLHPDDPPLRWSGIRLWRGAVETVPFLDGSTLLVAGSNLSKKFVAYPISAEAGRRGRALVNWVAELNVAGTGTSWEADWTAAGALEDVLPHFADWAFPYLDVAGLIENTERILHYPMVDRDPLPFWGEGRVTLLGDAAHPMYPIGSNGGSQAVLDARVLARALAGTPNPLKGLSEYEDERLAPTTKLVLAHRELPMDETIKKVDERAPQGFADIANVLTPAELAHMSEAQKRITDMDVAALNERPSWNVTR
ncbi:flavin-dependent oxidoreductase [Microtetraspora sp. NBRC 13810]|uniref:flavin-dependent oxidoreductase n=1 Tax=Microtetraspora sp. NBRC 13810 TaxID=3030990 RepID=UPI0024A18076|nr:flavin-dependent oxidoreductase [Microtetraspora sp. NBRC 13810]GLW04944.1 flavin-dependent oxidoreductase [Microtetraspora sp. NBRC 13810]